MCLSFSTPSYSLFPVDLPAPTDHRPTPLHHPSTCTYMHATTLQVRQTPPISCERWLMLNHVNRNNTHLSGQRVTTHIQQTTLPGPPYGTKHPRIHHLYLNFASSSCPYIPLGTRPAAIAGWCTCCCFDLADISICINLSNASG